jgi:hypothetical protein
MSCGPSCGSCGTQGDSNSQRNIHDLIHEAQKNWSVPLREDDANEWDKTFNVTQQN